METMEALGYVAACVTDCPLLCLATDELFGTGLKVSTDVRLKRVVDWSLSSDGHPQKEGERVKKTAGGIRRRRE
jgi:hypothetical protein